MQVGVPGKGSGEPFGSPHSPPKTRRACITTDKKIAAVAAYPPFPRDANPGAAFGRDFFHFNAPLMTRQVEFLPPCVKNALNARCCVKYLSCTFPIYFIFDRNLTHV